MHAQRNVLLEDLGPLAFVDAGDLEDLGRVEVRVHAPAHDPDPAHHHLVHGHGGVHREVDVRVPLHAGPSATRLTRNTYLGFGYDGASAIWGDGASASSRWKLGLWLGAIACGRARECRTEGRRA